MTTTWPRLSGRRATPADEGSVMVFVMLSMVVVALFATAGLSYAVQTQTFSRKDQDRNGALAAAQAGIDDYLARLNRDDAYFGVTDCTNPAVPRPGSATCPASAVSWQPVNPSVPAGPAFHYDVDGSLALTQGTVSIVSTGRVGGRTRTLNAVLGKQNSTDYLYYSDHENNDPADPTAYPPATSTNNPPAATMPPACNDYWWGVSQDTPTGTTVTKRSQATGCAERWFGTGDVLDGPVFSNDTPGMLVAGTAKPTFQQGLTTVEPACAGVVKADPTTWTLCDRTQVGATYAVAPGMGQAHYLPDTSASLATAPGCQYKGATRIQFNTDGTMTVWSRYSTATTAACGGPSPMGKIVSVPDNQVIYVRNDTFSRQCYGQEVDGTAASSTNGLPYGTPSANGYTGGTLPYGTFKGYANGDYIYDKMYHQPYDQTSPAPTLLCGQGNLFVAGTVKGRVTMATEASVVVTGSLTVASPTGRDVIGLVASSGVQVAQPRMMTASCNGQSLNCTETGPTDAPGSCGAGREIDASIQALKHGFFVQDLLSPSTSTTAVSQTGCLQGTLTVFGSIAQKWRGGIGHSAPDGTPDHGYVKNYRYDKRLKLRAPPYFPYWTNASWLVRRSGEVSPQYAS